jgi:hypothetical protein
MRKKLFTISFALLGGIGGLHCYRSFQDKTELQSAAKTETKSNTTTNLQLPSLASSLANSSLNKAGEERREVRREVTSISPESPQQVSKLKELLDTRLNTTVEMVSESWHQTFVDENGAYQAEYQATDGATVRQWYDTKGELQIEEFDYGPEGKLTKWREWGPEKDVVVQLDVGKRGVQARYHPNLQPKSEQSWDEEQTSQTEL